MLRPMLPNLSLWDQGAASGGARGRLRRPRPTKDALYPTGPNASEQSNGHRPAAELVSALAGRPVEELLRQRPGRRLGQVELVGVEEQFSQPDVERLL